MYNDWDRILLLLKLQFDKVCFPALLLGWGMIAAASFLCFPRGKDGKGNRMTAFLLYGWFIVGMTLLRAGKEEAGAVDLSLNFGSLLFWVRGGRRRMVYSLLNVLLFVPFGGLLRPILPFRRKTLLIALCGLLCSLVIEVLQLVFGLGVFELSDLIANCAGSLLGAVISGCLMGRKKGNEYE